MWFRPSAFFGAVLLVNGFRRRGNLFTWHRGVFSTLFPGLACLAVSRFPPGVFRCGFVLVLFPGGSFAAVSSFGFRPDRFGVGVEIAPRLELEEKTVTLVCFDPNARFGDSIARMRLFQTARRAFGQKRNSALVYRAPSFGNIF